MSGKDSDLTKLEMEYELQKQILKAKQKLARDESLPKNVRKKHTADCSEARTKVNGNDKHLGEFAAYHSTMSVFGKLAAYHSTMSGLSGDDLYKMIVYNLELFICLFYLLLHLSV